MVQYVLLPGVHVPRSSFLRRSVHLFLVVAEKTLSLGGAGRIAHTRVLKMLSQCLQVHTTAYEIPKEGLLFLNHEASHKRELHKQYPKDNAKWLKIQLYLSYVCAFFVCFWCLLFYTFFSQKISYGNTNCTMSSVWLFYWKWS